MRIEEIGMDLSWLGFVHRRFVCGRVHGVDGDEDVCGFARLSLVTVNGGPKRRTIDIKAGTGVNGPGERLMMVRL